MKRLAQLHEVQREGAAAQATRAAELIELLEATSDDQDAALEADTLIEAYLHDPYLTKDAPNRGSQR